MTAKPRKRKSRATRKPQGSYTNIDGDRITVSQAMRRRVKGLSLMGYQDPYIAGHLGIPPQKLHDVFGPELRYGRAEGDAELAATAYEQAMGGDTSMLIFLCKSRLGWTEKRRLHLQLQADNSQAQGEQDEAQGLPELLSKLPTPLLKSVVSALKAAEEPVDIVPSELHRPPRPSASPRVERTTQRLEAGINPDTQRMDVTDKRPPDA